MLSPVEVCAGAFTHTPACRQARLRRGSGWHLTLLHKKSPHKLYWLSLSYTKTQNIASLQLFFCCFLFRRCFLFGGRRCGFFSNRGCNCYWLPQQLLLELLQLQPVLQHGFCRCFCLRRWCCIFNYRCNREWDNRYIRTVIAFFLKTTSPAANANKVWVPADTYVKARIVFGTTLANNDITRNWQADHQIFWCLNVCYVTRGRFLNYRPLFLCAIFYIFMTRSNQAVVKNLIIKLYRVISILVNWLAVTVLLFVTFSSFFLKMITVITF